MPKLTITIETGNDAFKQNPYEIRDILSGLFESDLIPDGLKLFDHNGNQVGRVSWEDD